MHLARASLSPALLFLAACGLYGIGLDAPPLYDELYHFLAAKSWVANGTLAIADGFYERTSLFTVLVGELFRLFGADIVVQRLPSLFASALLVACFFVWLRARADARAAWLASLILLTSPFTLEYAQFGRFYALQVLAFFLGVVAVDHLTRQRWSRPGMAIGLAAAAAVALLLALYLQVTSAIGLLGLAAWLVVEIVLPWLWRQPPSRRFALIGLVLVLATLAATGLVASGLAEALLARYRSTTAWLSGAANQPWFYHYWFVLYYPTLWTLVPILTGFALIAHGRVTRLCLGIFVTAFVLHSFAGMKDPRYLAYALPFLWALFGMGLAAVWSPLRGALIAAWWRIVPRPASPALARQIERGVLLALILFVIIANAASVRSAMRLAGLRVPPQPPLVKWDEAAATLAPWMSRVDIRLTTDELAMLYYLGDYDVMVSRSRLGELPTDADFTADFRTGRPVVASPEAVAALIACYPSGLLVGDAVRWRHPAQLTEEVAELVARYARPLALPEETQVFAYVWGEEDPDPPLDGASCTELHRRLDR